MPAYVRQAPPRWFGVVAVLLILWGLAGIFAFYSDVSMNETRLAAMSEYDRAFYRSRPGWFVWIYGIATWSGLFGAVALWLRRRLARPLFILSLVAVVVQFGWVFLATDIVAAKGAVAVLPFPLLILGIAIVQISLATRGWRRGWLQ
ncbi:hypothetical protein [Sphingomonas sp.]|uniref:hypothetical protein n=1 Tax=Sphingomonas sp. TaxID=28214 RepID=UPI002BCC878B|nr:hypothetical protein [Sphingomonas sp.]HTG39520.1 hypothetical protein [Sphingomonas sp.]